MDSDPIAKLQSDGDSKRISVRFLSRDSVIDLHEQVARSGAFYLKLDGEMPSSTEIQVLLRTARRGEQFPATILAWSRGTVALKPDIPTADFEELARTLARALDRESDESGLHLRSHSDESIEIPDARALLEAEAEASGRKPLPPERQDPPPVEPSPRVPSGHQPAAGVVNRPKGAGRDAGRIRRPSRPTQPPPPPPVPTPVPMAMEDVADVDDEPVSHDTPTKDLSRPTPRPLAKLEPPSAETEAAAAPRKGEELWRRSGTDAHRPVPTRHPEARRGDFSPPSQPASDRDAGHPPPPKAPPPPPIHSATTASYPRTDGTAPPAVPAWDSDEHVSVAQDRDLLDVISPAFGFLRRLPLAPESLGGVRLGDGCAALDALIESSADAPEEAPSVLFAEDLEDERSWILLAAAGKIVNAFRTPVVGSACATARLHLQGVLGHDDVERVAAYAEREGCAEERALDDLGLVGAAALAEVARAKADWVTGDLALAENVEFRLGTLLRRPDRAPPLEEEPEAGDLAGCIAELERKSLSDIANIHEEYLDRPPRLVLRADLLSQTYDLSDEVESLLTEYVTGGLTLRQIYQRSRLSRSRTFAVLFGLEAMKLLRFDAPTRFEHDDESLLAWIDERAGQPAGFDDFALLGVSWLATGSELDAAWQRVQRDLDVARCGPLGEAAVTKAKRVLERAQAAYERLSSVQARNAYRQQITAPGSLSHAVSLLEAIHEIAEVREDRATCKRLGAQLEELRSAAP